MGISRCELPHYSGLCGSPVCSTFVSLKTMQTTEQMALQIGIRIACRLAAAAACALLALRSAQAQPAAGGCIEGRVTDARTGEAICGAALVVVGTIDTLG